MPDKYGNTQVVIPRKIMEEIVLPTQRRLTVATGIPITHGLVVRRLIELGFAADMLQSPQSHVSDGGK